MSHCQKCGGQGLGAVTHVCPPVVTGSILPVARPPALCPVCLGRQSVAAGFYMDGGRSTLREKCRTCNGKGIV